jgi:hypothetical protein
MSGVEAGTGKKNRLAAHPGRSAAAGLTTLTFRTAK